MEWSCLPCCDLSSKWVSRRQFCYCITRYISAYAILAILAFSSLVLVLSHTTDFRLGSSGLLCMLFFLFVFSLQVSVSACLVTFHSPRSVYADYMSKSERSCRALTLQRVLLGSFIPSFAITAVLLLACRGDGSEMKPILVCSNWVPLFPLVIYTLFFFVCGFVGLLHACRVKCVEKYFDWCAALPLLLQDELLDEPYIFTVNIKLVLFALTALISFVLFSIQGDVESSVLRWWTVPLMIFCLIFTILGCIMNMFVCSTGRKDVGGVSQRINCVMGTVLFIVNTSAFCFLLLFGTFLCSDKYEIRTIVAL
jgi:hypothetical protein